MTNWTAVYVPVPEGYIAFVEELPGANYLCAKICRDLEVPKP